MHQSASQVKKHQALQSCLVLVQSLWTCAAIFSFCLLWVLATSGNATTWMNEVIHHLAVTGVGWTHSRSAFCFRSRKKSKVYILDFSFYHLWTGLTVRSMVGSYYLFLIFVITVWSKHGPRAYSNTANLILALKKKGKKYFYLFLNIFFC